MLVLSRLHELHQSKFPFIYRVEFVRSKLPNLSAHVSGPSMGAAPSSPWDRRCVVLQMTAARHRTAMSAEGLSPPLAGGSLAGGRFPGWVGTAAARHDRHITLHHDWCGGPASDHQRHDRRTYYSSSRSETHGEGPAES